MNTQRWLTASIAAFVVIVVLEFVINGSLLADLYNQTAAVWRPPADRKDQMWLWLVSYAISAFVFALIYAQGHEPAKAGAAQGTRYGVYMGLFLGAPMGIGFYSVLPIPFALGAGWFIAELVVWAIAGAVVGAIYKRS